MKPLVTLLVSAIPLTLLAATPSVPPNKECCSEIAAAAPSPQEETAASTRPAAAPAANAAHELFEQLKSLAGKWTADAMGQPGVVVYSLTGGGSAVVENAELHGGMMTIFTLDGDRVVATHYCAAGNQPRMASTGIKERKAVFEFIDATGMNTPNDPHMRRLELTFTDTGVTQAWTFYEDAQAKGVVHLTLKRAD